MTSTESEAVLSPRLVFRTRQITDRLRRMVKEAEMTNDGGEYKNGKWSRGDGHINRPPKTRVPALPISMSLIVSCCPVSLPSTLARLRDGMTQLLHSLSQRRGRAFSILHLSSCPRFPRMFRLSARPTLRQRALLPRASLCPCGGSSPSRPHPQSIHPSPQ